MPGRGCGDCLINGVSGGFYWWVLAAGMRSAKVVANAFNAGFQRMPHRVWPVPLGSNDLTVKYKVFSAACSFGKCPRALTARRNLALRLSIAFVEHRTLRISTQFDCIPADRRDGALAELVRLVHSNDDRLDTGFLSVPYLLDVLWDGGERALARTLLWQDQCPSWLYEVDHGATTIWEAWDCVKPDGTVGSMSFNHYAFGCVVDFIYRRLAGLQNTSPGWRTATIAPDLGGPLDHVSAHIDTPLGRLAIDWTRDGGTATAAVDVPVGCTATVDAPDGWTADVSQLAQGHHEITYRKA